MSAANCTHSIVQVVTHTHSSVVCIAIVSVAVISWRLRVGIPVEVDSAMPTLQGLFCLPIIRKMPKLEHREKGEWMYS